MTNYTHRKRGSFDRLRHSKRALADMAELATNTPLDGAEAAFDLFQSKGTRHAADVAVEVMNVGSPTVTLADISASTNTSTLDAAGSYTVGASSRITAEDVDPTPNSTCWVLTVVEDLPDGTTGTYRPRFLGATSGTIAPEGTRQRTGQQSWRFPDVEDSTDLDFVTGGTFGPHTVHSMDLYEMDAILARDFDVIVGFGQSNLVGADTEHDVVLDGLRDETIFYAPGTAYSQYGARVDEFQHMTPPLQFGSWSGGSIVNASNFGVTPAINFMRHVRSAVDSSRNVLFIATAVSGSDSLASDAPWNPSGSDPQAYNACIARVDAIMAQLSAGSRIIGVLAAFGEGDSSADMSAWPAKIEEIKDGLEADWLAAGYIDAATIPWIWINAPENATRANQGELVTVTRQMDAASGHANSIANLYVVDRPKNSDMLDSTHVANSGQRIAGDLAGQRFVDVTSS